jgi:hypothetical protein
VFGMLSPATGINADWRKRMSRRRFQNPTPKLEWGNWYIFPREDYQQPDGTVKRKTIRVLLGSAGKMNFKQAEREAAAQMQHLNSLNYRPRSGKTFAEFAEEWMETCMIAPAYSPSSIPSMTEVPLTISPKF